MDSLRNFENFYSIGKHNRFKSFEQSTRLFLSIEEVIQLRMHSIVMFTSSASRQCFDRCHGIKIILKASRTTPNENNNSINNSTIGLTLGFKDSKNFDAN